MFIYYLLKLTDELLASIQENHVCIEDISNQSADQSIHRLIIFSKLKWE